MKTIFLSSFAFLLLSYSSLDAQNASFSSLTSAGDFSKNNGGMSLSWTMGEVFSQTMNSGQFVTEGFQQGALAKIDVALIDNPIEAPSIEVDVSKNAPVLAESPMLESITIYPNPVAERLRVKLSKEADAPVSINILDTSGRTILSMSPNAINAREYDVANVDQLPAGNYFIQVSTGNVANSAVPFIKL